MLAILIPRHGRPNFEHVADHQRGQTLQRILKLPRTDVDDLRPEALIFHKQIFEWRTSYVQQDGTHIFDIWEEVN